MIHDQKTQRRRTIIMDMGTDKVEIINTDTTVLQLFDKRTEIIKEVLHNTGIALHEFNEKDEYHLCPQVNYNVVGYIGKGLSLNVDFYVISFQKLSRIQKFVKRMSAELKEYTFTKKLTPSSIWISAEDNKIKINFRLSLL